jgi:benzoylsuccinyl-CoA thiolase BbsA subunit
MGDVMFREGVLEAAEDGTPRLVASRCLRCGRIGFPAQARCSTCWDDPGAAVERIWLSPRGRLYAFTVIRLPAKGFAAPLPFGYVDLPEGLRISAPLTDLPADATELPAGTPVELTLGPIRVRDDGTRVIGYQFRPCGRPDDGTGVAGGTGSA